MINTPNKLEMKENFLNLIKDTYKKLTISIILSEPWPSALGTQSLNH